MITEMNASPTPQWAEEFQKSIMADYNICRTDAIFITGKVCKIVREQKAIDDEELGKALLYCTNKTAERVKKEMIEKACKAHCSLCIAHIACRERGEFYCQDIEEIKKIMEE